MVFDEHLIRQTCILMGVVCSAEAQFVWDAVEWLARRSLNGISIAEQDGCFTVRGFNYIGQGESLSVALCAAVRSYQAERCGFVCCGGIKTTEPED